MGFPLNKALVLKFTKIMFPENNLLYYNLPRDNVHRKTFQGPYPQIHKDDDECWNLQLGKLQKETIMWVLLL